MKYFFYFFQMKNLIFSLLIILLSSCERYALPISDLTLSGKYKLTLLDVTSVDQNVSKDSLYRAGSVYLNPTLPKPFDSIVLNRFYIHLDYSTLRMNLLGVSSSGNDIWEYGSSHSSEVPISPPANTHSTATHWSATSYAAEQLQAEKVCRLTKLTDQKRI